MFVGRKKYRSLLFLLCFNKHIKRISPFIGIHAYMCALCIHKAFPRFGFSFCLSLNYYVWPNEAWSHYYHHSIREQKKFSGFHPFFIGLFMFSTSSFFISLFLFSLSSAIWNTSSRTSFPRFMTFIRLSIKVWVDDNSEKRECHRCLNIHTYVPIMYVIMSV